MAKPTSSSQESSENSPSRRGRMASGTSSKDNKAALYKSLGVHVAIAIVLLISVSFAPDPLPTPAPSQPVIQATFIDAQAIADKQKAKEEAQRKADEAARQRQAEAERKRQAEAERKRKAEAERQRQINAEKARKQAEQKRAEEKRKAEAEAQRQKELERRAAQEAKERREREAREKAEAERKQKEAREKAEMERIMQEQMEAERAAQQKRRQQQVLSEVDRYKALIQNKIIQGLYNDSAYKGKQCRLNIRLATTGFVTQVRTLGGDPALCRAAEAAVRRPDKLPMSAEADVYQELKDINLTVEL